MFDNFKIYTFKRQRDQPNNLVQTRKYTWQYGTKTRAKVQLYQRYKSVQFQPVELCTNLSKHIYLHNLKLERKMFEFRPAEWSSPMATSGPADRMEMTK